MIERKTIFFDLEGPLAPEDNAYELMKSFPEGEGIFERISRYDDLLTLEGKKGYEPGDTLALITPFLLFHRIKEKYITQLAEVSPLTPGAADLIRKLTEAHWNIFCISTSYSQYAMNITERIGIPAQNVACTHFPLDTLHSQTDLSELKELEKIEGKIMSIPLNDDQKLKKVLDNFYWTPPIPIVSQLIKQIKPVGGNRKVAAVLRFLSGIKVALKQVVAVGDSITDCRMLENVRNASGLAIAFNSNEYALPYANVGLASTHLSDLLYVLEPWQKKGLKGVDDIISSEKLPAPENERYYFQWLPQQHLSMALQIHKRIRKLVRAEAAKLG